MKAVKLAALWVDVNLKNQYLIEQGDLFIVDQDPADPSKSHLTYCGKVPKKLLKALKNLT